MPFITEQLWQSLPNDCESIMISNLPVYDENLNFAGDEQEFEKIMNVIKAIRNARNEMNVPPSKKANVYIETEYVDIFKSAIPFLQKLASAAEVFVDKSNTIEGALSVVTDAARVSIPLDALIDKEKELERLNREKATCQKDIDMLSGKLSNEKFVARAPKEIVEQERAKLSKAQELMAKIEESIKQMEK
ncbi:MAG: class I tRNA ligase family protein, partial [Oscillospiraceae bacterium]|nr:class I tRNA ligase family protein [Oscillospiraceae bacterium]